MVKRRREKHSYFMECLTQIEENSIGMLLVHFAISTPMHEVNISHLFYADDTSFLCGVTSSSKWDWLGPC